MTQLMPIYGIRMKSVSREDEKTLCGCRPLCSQKCLKQLYDNFVDFNFVFLFSIK